MSDDEYEIKLVNIEPAKMMFVFELSESECHQILTGICSLEGKKPTGTQKRDESDYEFCTEMFEWISGKGDPKRAPLEWWDEKLPVSLVKYSCGHYAFSDGQHRACIAKKKGLKLRAEVEVNNRLCDFCEGKPRSKHAQLR
ncbi:MAG: hypothetical protein ACKVZH_01000 [Blastocatellia bacterium]